MSTQLLDFDYIDAQLPKEPIGPVRRRLLRRYRGVLSHDKIVQNTYYWCGPTTAQMILKARGVSVSQASLAKQLGTDEDGTDYIGLFPPVLNRHLPGAGYFARNAPGEELLWKFITDSIDSGFGVAANIVAYSWNRPPDYPWGPTYHYVPIFGYRTLGASRRQVYCADSANFNGRKDWWVDLSQMASLVREKGVAPIPRKNSNLLGMSDAALAEFADHMRQLGPS